MEDIEKSRTEYVHSLEVKIKHLQAEHNRYKAIADKWQPVLTVIAVPQEEKTVFGLAFGGKKMQASTSIQFLQEMDTTSIVSTLAETFFENLIKEHLKTIILPEVERVKAGAEAMKGIGKW